MTGEKAFSFSGADPVLTELLDEVTSKLQAGEPVDLEAYRVAHPEHFERLQRLFPTLQAMVEMGRSQTGGSQRDPPRNPGPGDALETGVLGDFRIRREIGRGGMGVVYEAEQISLGRRVALKILPFAAVLDPRQLRRFKNEAQAAASLEHPNIVAIHSVGCERGIHFYAMQFVEGQTLAEVIAELRDRFLHPEAGGAAPRVAAEGAVAQAEDEQPSTECHVPSAENAGQAGTPYSVLGTPAPAVPSPAAQTQPQPRPGSSTKSAARGREFFRSVAQLGIQAAEALEHAHQSGVVHRDIKPSNLLVDAQGHLWITDFGLAVTQRSPDLTVSGDLVGTLRYMSPEQLEGNRQMLDHRTDVYSLGVTLYEILTLRPAFDADSRERLTRDIVTEEPPVLRKLNGSVPRDLETILLKAMSKDPSQRYATAQDLADDLKRFLADEPIAARRPSVVQRLGKWSRRHKSLVLATAVVLVLAVVGLSISTALIWRAQQRTAGALAEVHAVADFLVDDMLGTPIQQAGRSPDISRKEAAERAEVAFARSFEAGPLVEASIRFAVGRTYDELALYDRAQQNIQRACQLYRQSAGATDRQTLRCRAFLGSVVFHQGKLAEARTELEQVLDTQRRIFGENDPETLLSMEILADVDCAEGKVSEGRSLREETLEARRFILGEDHPMTLRSMSNLADIFRREGALPEAAELYAQTLEGRRRVLGDDHPEAVRAMDDLATVLQEQGKSDQAQRLLGQMSEARGRVRRTESPGRSERGYSGRRGDVPTKFKVAVNAEPRLWGDDNRHVFSSTQQMARSLLHDDDLAGAWKLYEELTRGQRRELGWDHPDTLISMYDQACILDRQHKLAEARKLHERVLAVRRRMFGSTHPHTLLSMNALAGVLLQQGELAEARKLCEEACRGHSSLLAEDAVEFLTATDTLIGVLVRQGRLTEARKLYDQQLEAYRCFHMEKNLLCAVSSAKMAWYLMTNEDERFRDLASAIELALRAVKVAPAFRDFWHTLGQAHYRAGNWEDAASAFQQAARVGGPNLYDSFFLVMSRWQRSKKCLAEQHLKKQAIEPAAEALQRQAREEFERAVQLMEEAAPKDPELLQLRAEAAKLLGIMEEPGGAKAKPEKR